MAAIAASTMCVIPMANSFSASAAALRKKNAFLVSDSKAVSSSDSSDSSDSTKIAVNSELAEELSKSNALRFYEETASDTGKTTLDISASELKDMQLEVILELEALTSRFEAEIAELGRVSDMKGMAGSLLRIDGMLGELDHVFTGIDSLFTMDTKGIRAGKTTLNKRIGASLSKLDTLLGNGIGVGVYGPSNFGSTVLGGGNSGVLCENSCGGFTGVSGQGGYTGVSCGESKNNTSNGGSKSGTTGGSKSDKSVGSKSGKSGSSKSGKSSSSKDKKSGEQKHYNTCEDVFGEAACKKAQELLDATSKVPGTTPSGGDDDDKKDGTSSGNNGDGTSCEDPNADRNGSGSGNGKIVIPGGGFTDPAASKASVRSLRR
ncbi:MAG: hypothetical protein K6G33_02895 [Ruminococcus sp.]|uniref:hypothetical protein n=1 Tax=Ruminococcus sp. TaxID=41978 RepID=UPI0025D8D815|nr:hypothetical protein [Ruminococcus sp.]MCR5599677.1 hypothetical protein [Ruminococcus sp.]